MIGQGKTGEEELRDAVRTIVWEPVEPLFLWVARIVTRWFV